MYEKGEGIPQNREESVALLHMAAEQGLEAAQANLGIMYFEGMGVKKDEVERLKWLLKAAAQGLDEAQMVLKIAGIQ